jgi:hypothetical protein
MPTLLRWLQQQDERTRALAALTWLAVPVWHLLAHRCVMQPAPAGPHSPVQLVLCLPLQNSLPT